MKFSCLQENFAQAIQTVGHLALKAGSLPVLNNIAIKASQGTLTFTATNLEAGVVHTMRGKIVEDGECLVPSRLLLDLIPLLTNGPVSAELVAEGLVLTTETTTSTLRVHPTPDFPIIPTIDEPKSEATIRRESFVRALSMVVGAAGKTENRPQFNGVLMVVADKNLSFVATDGFRLAEGEVPLEAGSSSVTARVIIPLATAQETARILSSQEEDERVSIQVAENQVKITTSTTAIISRLIEGEYPDYLPLFPTKASTIVVVEPPALVRALKASTLFSKAGLSTVVLSIDAKEKFVKVSSESGDVGAHTTTIACGVEGEDLRVVVNTRYVLDGLASIAGKAVLGFTGGDRPLLVTPEKDSLPGFRYLIMPIRQ